jgi:UPF0716 protein FxsA
MPLFLAIVFLAVPIIEITMLIQVGGAIGVWRTVALVVLTAIIGAAMLRRQGLKTLMAAQESLARNEMPVAELFDGACLLVAGALLLTPGFFTDAVGFLLFVPPVRAAMRGVLARWLANRPNTTIIIDGEVVRRGDEPPPGPRDGRTIEADFRRVEDRKDDDEDPPADSRWGRRR